MKYKFACETHPYQYIRVDEKFVNVINTKCPLCQKKLINTGEIIITPEFNYDEIIAERARKKHPMELLKSS